MVSAVGALRLVLREPLFKATIATELRTTWAHYWVPHFAVTDEAPQKFLYFLFRLFCVF
jgi:hypothetical protein